MYARVYRNRYRASERWVLVSVVQSFGDGNFFYPERRMCVRVCMRENDSMGNLQSIFASVFLVWSGCSIYHRLSLRVCNETRAVFLTSPSRTPTVTSFPNFHRLEFCVRKIDAIIDSALKYAFAVFGIKHNLNKSLAYGRRMSSHFFWFGYHCCQFTLCLSALPYPALPSLVTTKGKKYSISQFYHFFISFHFVYISCFCLCYRWICTFHIGMYWFRTQYVMLLLLLLLLLARTKFFLSFYFTVRDWVYSTLSLCYHLRLANFVPRHWSLGRRYEWFKWKMAMGNIDCHRCCDNGNRK